MGIEGLLRNIKNCTQQRQVKDYKGKVAAIDTYGWLHKIIKGPAGRDIILNRNKERYVTQCLKRIQKLQKQGLQVIMVFDGGPLPKKAGEQEQRKKRREQNQKKGLELIEQGQKQLGIKKLTDAIDVTPEVAYKLILELKKKKIRFIVAPYEADAQLAYLSRKGIADIIITEDGDLLVFGAKRILYKLDYITMVGEEICLDDIKNSIGGLDFTWFTHCMFMTMCIMAGCDYLPQISGVGLKTAHKLISRNNTLPGALNQINLSGKQIPSEYEKNFVKAFLTFRFQRVYCPQAKKCVEINQYKTKEIIEIIDPKSTEWSEEILDLYIKQAIKNQLKTQIQGWDFIGNKMNDIMVQRIAEGQLDPTTFRPYIGIAFQNLNYNQQLKENQNEYPQKMKKNRSIQHQPTQMNSISSFLQTGSMISSKRTKFEFKQISTGEQCYSYINYEDEDNRNDNVFSLNPIKKKNKNSLQINQQQNEGEEIESENQCGDNYSEMVSENQWQESHGSKSGQGELSTKASQSNIWKLAKMFQPIFSDEYLRAPFSQ